MGERLNGIQEVRGSTPLSSIVRAQARAGILREPGAEILSWARVAELADAQDSGSCGGNPVRVRVPPRACRLFVRVHPGRSDLGQIRPVRFSGVAHVLELVDRLV